MFNPLTPYLTMKELKFSTRNAILDIFLDVRAYIADVFGGDSDDVTLDWNAVGACIHYFDNRRNIQFRLWERSEGHLGIPDMTLIIINISFRGTSNTVHSEMIAFVHWLQQTAKINGFLYFADENHGPLSTDQAPGCRIACYRL